MAPTKTTTIRVPVSLRDDIARLATTRGASLVDTVEAAIELLTRDEWWRTVHEALATMSPTDLAGLQAETEGLGGSGTDGL